MSHDRIAAAIAVVRPGAVWRLRGDDYAGLEWLDHAQPKPTRAEIEAVVLPAPVPAAVSPVQFRKALRHLGYADRVAQAARAAPPDVVDEWEYGSRVTRSGPVTAWLAAALDLAAGELDALFRLADTL